MSGKQFMTRELEVICKKPDQFLYITLNKGRKINPCINPIFREKWLINLLAHQYWDLCPLQKIDAELILMQA